MIQINVISFTSNQYEGKNFTARIKARDCQYDIKFNNSGQECKQPPRYFPAEEYLQIRIFIDEKDKKIPYFRLPLQKIYKYPVVEDKNKQNNHIIKLECVWLQTDTKKLIINEGISGILQVHINYMKFAVPELQFVIQSVIMKNGQFFGSNDQFMQCYVSDMKTKIQIKKPGKPPSWKKVQTFKLKNIPGIIIFDLKKTPNDIIGSVKINPHQANIFVIDQEIVFAFDIKSNNNDVIGSIYLRANFILDQ